MNMLPASTSPWVFIQLPDGKLLFVNPDHAPRVVDGDNMQTLDPSVDFEHAPLVVKQRHQLLVELSQRLTHG